MSNKQVVAYIRVTTKEQAKSGYSLEAQHEKLKEYAEQNNLMIVKEFFDVGSGKSTKRQGFQEMLKFLENSNNCKSILVLKFDRLCRDLQTFYELQKKYRIICVPYSLDIFVQQSVVMFAEQYSKALSIAIKAGLQKKKARETKEKQLLHKVANATEL